MVKPKQSKKKDKKTATFAEATSKGALWKPEPKVKYNKCVVAFAIRVDKGKDTKAGFDKKMLLSYPSFKPTSTNMPPPFPLTSWTQVDLPSKKRQTYRPSRSFCADILTSLTKGPLTV